MSELRVVFMGTPQFAVPSLEKIAEKYRVVGVYTQPDRPVGRGMELAFSPVKKKAIELGLPIFQPEKLSQAGEFEKLAELCPDVIVVVAYGQILKRNVLELPRLGCINVHSSLLPRWRGAAPIQAALLAGDEESGVTTMRLVEKLDAGDILLQEKTKILSTDTAGTLHDRLMEIGSRLIVQTLSDLEAGMISPMAQEETRVTYAGKLNKSMEAIDPSCSAVELDRRIRALLPWPGSSLRVENLGRVKIKSVVLQPTIQGQMGYIFEQAGMLLLGCASGGALQLLRVQQEGRKEVDAAAFANGLKGSGIRLPLRVLGPEISY